MAPASPYGDTAPLIRLGQTSFHSAKWATADSIRSLSPIAILWAHAAISKI